MDFIKQYRKDKQYLFIGLRMNRDTERMVLSDLIYASGKPSGWALIAEPNEKERRFCKKMNIEIIEADIDDLGGLPLLSIRNYAMRGYRLLFKRIMEFSTSS